MKIKLASSNRFTLPKSIVHDCGLSIGQEFEIIYDPDANELRIKLDKCQEKTFSENSMPKSISKGKQIVSNLIEGANFKVKHYSDCGLIVRTKKSYLQKVCDQCQGQLLNNGNYGNRHCKYINCKEAPKDITLDKVTQPVVTQPKVVQPVVTQSRSNAMVMTELSANIASLNHKLDADIKSLTTGLVTNYDVKSKGETVMMPIEYKGVIPCVKCGYLTSKGILVNNLFQCLPCAKSDFIEFYKNYKRKGV